MPVRDEQRWVSRALRSMQRQTLVDIEILVVDDGSVDGTTAIVRHAARDDPRIRLVDCDGRGFTNALNTGLRHATAPLIARLDADDLALRHRLARQVRELYRNPRALVVGTYGYRINEWGLPVGRLRTGPLGREGYHRAMATGACIRLTHSSAMFRREPVMEEGGYRADYHPADDFELWNRLAQKGEVYALPDRLTLYTLRRRSISVDDAVRMAQQVARVLVEHGQGVGPPPEAIATNAAFLQHRRRVQRALLHGDVMTALVLLRAPHFDAGNVLKSAWALWRR